jgi:rubrerythrin
MTTIHDKLTARFLDKMLSNPAGRVHLLSQMATAEESDEAQLFERIRAHVSDPGLKKLIHRHEQDEVRHAQLFWECVERQGVPVPPVPEELQMIDRLDAALGGIFEGEIDGSEGVLNVYLLLQVIEERALTQFEQAIPSLERWDPTSAQIMTHIARDEERHLKYCVAITRQLAPDEETRLQRLQEFRAVEARVFGELVQLNLALALRNGALNVSAWERAGWQAALGVLRRTKAEDRTRFWDELRAQRKSGVQVAGSCRALHPTAKMVQSRVAASPLVP